MLLPFISNELQNGDERFMLILLTLRSVNTVFRKLYSKGAWLSRDEAEHVGQTGMLMLRSYRRLADLSAALAQPRFPVHSKFHMMWHIFHTLQACAKRNLQWVESPLVDSCQQDEGFVGIISRYSRRVSPKMTVWRTLDLYKASLWKRWRREET